MNTRLIKIIARQEWAAFFRARLPLGLYAVLLSMSILAIYIGWQYVNNFNEHQTEAKEEVHDHWMKQPDRHPHRVAHYGYLVFREKSPLSFFDFGLDSYVGNSVFLEAHRQNTINMSEAGFSNGMLRFGELSMAVVFQLLVPLFIIFIGFHTIAGLKENGLLKILLCQKATFRDVLLGKAAGITLLTWFLFLPLLFLGLLIGTVSHSAGLSTDELIRMGLIVLSYGIYFLIISMIVVAVSAISTNARNALMALVLIWILFYVMVPKSAQNLGNTIFVAPDKITFEQGIESDIAKVGDSHNPNDPHFSELKESTLKRYGVDSIQALPINYGALVMQEGENISSGIFDKHYNQLIQIYKSQNSIASFLSFIDPFLAIRNISMNLSGTDFESFTEFQKQTERYRFEKTQALNKIHLNQIKFKDDSKQRVNAQSFQQQPEFKFQPVPIKMSLRHGAMGISALFFWVLASFTLLSFISKKRQFQL
ncbi:ABC transporter permease [Dyadobacter tibetensis]|uniref:ABC transporter permease n=1 Tax=Dyadobacter tibetensis TaxID=1211851 RepID=UPI0004722661|nr:DUF3526 domain-containing protein [Dyadobacter tibetensis]